MTPSAEAPAPAAVALSETGSTLLFPLFRSWADAYHSQYRQVSIATAATGSGNGIAGASDGTSDIGASDAFLSSGDLIENPSLLNIPSVVSAQQIDYNLPGLGADVHLKLNGQVLARMYQGRITAWNNPAITQLNPDVRLPATVRRRRHRYDRVPVRP